MKNTDKEMSPSTLHAEHRKRVKERFIREGLDNFPSHNVLELMLFYSIARKDTNELAHRLINEFGSVSGVFDAPYEQLIKIKGVSEHTATLIKLIPELSRKYTLDKLEKSSNATVFGSIKSLGTFFCSKYLGQTSEIVYLMLLNNKMQMIDCVKMHEGSVNSVGLSIRKIVETALTKNAASVVLAHNHPGGRPFPSTDDLNTTRLVRDALSNVGVDMVAHILVAENKYIDILENS